MTMTMADLSSGGQQDPGSRRPERGSARPGSPIRRTFSTAYKLRVVAEYDSLTVHGARGALLRREGLYQSHIEKWRRARDRGALSAAGARREATSAPESAENRRLRAENARLIAELEKTKAIVAVLGKTYALLETLSESAEPATRLPRSSTNR